MDNRKNFFIITWNNYPEGDAGAIRQHAFSKNIKDLGYRPIIIGMGKTTKFKKKIYDQIEYYSLRYANKKIVFRIFGRLFFFLNMKKILNKYSSKKIAGILIVSGDKNTFRCIEKYAKKNNIQLYHDSVEWYSESEFTLGSKDTAYKHNNDINTKYIDQKYKVFAISSYLEKHFKSKGVNAIRIPVIMDIPNIYNKINKSNKNKIKFLYAGHMGSKDHIDQFIKAISILSPKDQLKIEFNILGVTYDQYKSKYGIINQNLLNDIIFFRGRVSRNEVMDYLTNTDFTVLFRPSEERYAKAGFPTKSVESLSTGTPILCNLSSDLGMYLVDGKNSILVNQPTEKELKNAIKRILTLNKKQLEQMQMLSYETAINNFDRTRYLDDFRNFLIENNEI